MTIHHGDIIIGMVGTKITNHRVNKSIVDKIIITEDGHSIVKIRIRSDRIPCVGDMFAAQSNQR